MAPAVGRLREPWHVIGFVGPAGSPDGGVRAALLALLADIGPVQDMPIAADATPADRDRLVQDLAVARFDRIVFWRTEEIAARMLPLRRARFILIPDVVHAHRRPDPFWRQFVDHRFVALSRPLHERLQTLSCTTSHFQFCPEPPADPPAHDAGALFDESDPGGPANVALVIDQCRALGIDRLHVRTPALHPGRHRPQTISGIAITFADTAEEAPPGVMPRFFFASGDPDAAGAAIPTAMANGQIVVAPDAGDIADRVAHLTSGFLYAPATPTAGLAPLDEDALARMSRAARRKAEGGHRDWLADRDRLVSLIRDDGIRWSTRDRSAAFARAIREAAHRRAAHGR